MSKAAVYLILALGVGFLIIAGSWYYVSLNRVKKTLNQPATTQTLPDPAVTKPITFMGVEPVLSVNSAGTGNLELWLTPQTPGQPLSDMALKATLIVQGKGKLTAMSNSPTLSDEFKSSQWRFPFSKLVSQDDGSITLEMAASFASPTAYVSPSRFLLASIPLKTDVKQITLTFDPAVTKIFDKQHQEVGLIEVGQPITIEVTNK